jgi:hypothetical protein
MSDLQTNDIVMRVFGDFRFFNGNDYKLIN